jgi:hypothetical protein
MAATNQTNQVITKMNEHSISATFTKKFKIDYRDLEHERIHCPAPTSKQIPGKGANQTYMGAAVEYQVNDLDAKKPLYEEFRMEGPPSYSKYGIGELVDEKDGSKSYSIYTPLPSTNENLSYFKTTTLDGLHDTMCEYVEQYASYLGKSEAFTKQVAAASIPHFYRYPKDKITKQVQRNREPFLNNRVTIAGDNATIFIDLDKKIIPWRKLMGMEMMFVPLYSLGLYSGGMGLSFPFRMVECTVIWYRPRNVTSSQEDTVEKYKQQYYEEYKKSLEILSSRDSLVTNIPENTDNTLGIVSRTNNPEGEDKGKEEEEKKVTTPPKQEEVKAKPPPKRGLRERNQS